MDDLGFLMEKMEEMETDLDKMEAEYHTRSRLRTRNARARRMRRRKVRTIRLLRLCTVLLFAAAAALMVMRLRYRVPLPSGTAETVSMTEELNRDALVPYQGSAIPDADIAPQGGGDSPEMLPTEESGAEESAEETAPAPDTAPEAAAEESAEEAAPAPDTAPEAAAEGAAEEAAPAPDTAPEAAPEEASFVPWDSERTMPLGEDADVDSQFAVLVDAESGEILAERNSQERIAPASMTKVLTLLTAVEHIDSWEMIGTISPEIVSFCYVENCSVAGFAAWESVPVADLLYGCILPSGADACLALANRLAGSEEAFVAWMNEKLDSLGLSGSAHFTNCIGLYDENHYCTVRDLAVIMRAAMDNPTCRKVLGSRTRQTTATEEHPEGVSLSNWFLRRIEDRFTESPLRVNGGKTGYVKEAGSCAVSTAVRDDGREYICATGKAPGSWRVIHDHTILYQSFCTA